MYLECVHVIKDLLLLLVSWIRPLGAGLVLIVSRDFGTSASLYANLHHLARSQ